MPFVKSYEYELNGNYDVEEANGSFYKSTNRENYSTVLFPEDKYNIIKYTGKVYKLTRQDGNQIVYVADDDLKELEGGEITAPGARARAPRGDRAHDTKPWWKAWGGDRKTRRTCRTKGKTRRSKA
jgi:hypothetical protein